MRIEKLEHTFFLVKLGIRKGMLTHKLESAKVFNKLESTTRFHTLINSKNSKKKNPSTIKVIVFYCKNSSDHRATNNSHRPIVIDQ